MKWKISHERTGVNATEWEVSRDPFLDSSIVQNIVAVTHTQPSDSAVTWPLPSSHGRRVPSAQRGLTRRYS